jgi:hypothetical protein
MDVSANNVIGGYCIVIFDVVVIEKTTSQQVKRETGVETGFNHLPLAPILESG